MASKRRFSRFRRKRRISPGVWFPTTGTTFDDEITTYPTSSIIDTLGPGVPTNAADGPSWVVRPVTEDYTQFQTDLGTLPVGQRPSLRDYTEGQDYLLKRLVGQITIFVRAPITPVDPFAETASWSHVKIAAGFFVAKANDIDGTLPDLSGQEFDPFDSRNSQNSWIWRRTWILDNPANVYDIQTGHTFDYGIISNRDYAEPSGTFVDTKSKRRIKREQRLWLVVAAMGWDDGRVSVNGGADAQPRVTFDADIRIFGKMMKGRQNTAF